MLNRREMLGSLALVTLSGYGIGCGSSSTREGGPATARSAAASARFERYGVAADHPLASEAGARIMAAGGNAIDAAVATSFALSVVRPQSCGIGGGGFMVIRFTDGSTEAWNYRETCPAGVNASYYERIANGEGDDRASSIGGRAVATPGTVAGLLRVHERYGALGRGEVLRPAMELAGDGFAVDEAYVGAARGLAGAFRGSPEMRERFPFMWERFLFEGSVRVGSVLRLPEQAAALRAIALDGAEAFYRGPIAAAMVRAVEGDRGALGFDDLRGYEVDRTGTLTASIDGHAWHTMPPPSSGGVAMLETLGILRQLGLDLRDAASVSGLLEAPEGGGAATALTPHGLVEALKHAFADRAAFLGDPAFVDVPIDRLLSRRHARELADRFEPGRTLEPTAYGTAAGIEDGGTSHFSVVDEGGTVVACTETINGSFGSLLAVPEYGFCLNNEMDDFLTRRGVANIYGLQQSEANLPEPGKRPLSSMSPTIVVTPGDDVISCGASGGPRIITATLQAILRSLAGDDAGACVGKARLHHQWLPNYVGHDGVAEDVLGSLREVGHEVRRIDSVGVAQMIRIGAGGEGGRSIGAASDPRKGGAPAGV